MKSGHDHSRLRTRLTEAKEGNIGTYKLQTNTNKFSTFMKAVHVDMSLNVMANVRGRRVGDDEGERDLAN